MKIVEYDQIDPLGALHLSLSGLDYALTPECAAAIRRLDPRPFPFFAIYAVEDETVVGQVGVYRLPMVSTEGPEDVGGVYAVCTHPAFDQHGIATRLLDEAHDRMRAAGLRFSTLGTSRHRVAYKLYQRLGYESVFTPTSTIARCADVCCPSPLRAERADSETLELTDAIFAQVATGHLGFARRHRSFISMLKATGSQDVDDVWLLRGNGEPVGYALATVFGSILKVSHLLLVEGVDAAAAVSAIVQDLPVSYIQVRVDHASVAASLERAGYPTPRPSWSTFMVKPLVPDVTVQDARRLFGIGTDRFLISSIDVT
ncbi:MAG: GNAT family N-acetyltransferase [Chloroflexi bacterium]|nr:GNAT family N-acetyltransferase [Chloroflexota bacterium]